MIWCLHGFLGEVSDWESHRSTFARWNFQELRAPNYLRASLHGRSLWDQAQTLVREIEAVDRQPLLVGYSLGGRLALHMLLLRPQLFRGAVLVSAGMGIENPSARRERWLLDEQWAQRFEREEWTSLLTAWNAQSVFGGRAPDFVRREADFDRRTLAAVLRDWSPARQDPLFSRLHEVQCPVLWMAGADDTAYATAATRAAGQLPRRQIALVPGAAHRVPWENSAAFARAFGAFIQTYFPDGLAAKARY